MILKKNFLFMLIIFVLIFSFSVYAKEYKAAVIQTPLQDLFKNLLNAIAQETNNTIDVQSVPSGRAIYIIENKEIDILCPGNVSNDPKKVAELKYDFSTTYAYLNTFVIYTNKSKSIDIKSLKRGNPKKYIIETTASLADLFEFTPELTMNTEASLQKVDNGAIDGFIYVQTSGDILLKKLALKNIKRQLYSQNKISFAIQKGAKGTDVDKMITEAIKKLKAKGIYDQLLGPVVNGAKYDDWQQ